MNQISSHTYKAVVLGHSFTRRLQTHCRVNTQWNNLGLSPQTHNITFIGQDGAGKDISLSDQIMYHMPQCDWASVDLLILDVGSNDLNSVGLMPPQNLVIWLIHMANDFLSRGVRRVLLCEIMFRKGAQAFPRDLPITGSIAEAESKFLARAHQANCLLRIRAAEDPRMDVLKTRGLHAWRGFLCRDGVHLTPAALDTYARNFRSAIIRHCAISKNVNGQ